MLNESTTDALWMVVCAAAFIVGRWSIFRFVIVNPKGNPQ